MKKLWLYALFQGNLQYSCIPEEDYVKLLDNTYWPFLELLDKYDVGFGISFTAFSLEILDKLDSTFIGKIKELIAGGKLDLFGHGYSQGVFALIPSEVNKANLRLGMDVYQALLGFKPTTVFINEQVYGAGLPRMYKDAGYENIFIEWESVNKFRTFPQEYLYSPQKVVGVDGTEMRLIWNASEPGWRLGIYGGMDQITFDQYVNSLRAHYSDETDRAFIIHGGDWETENYHVREGWINDKVIENYKKLFKYISENDWLELVTPGQILGKFDSPHTLRLELPEYPLPCWSVDKYNLTRWAVNGRDDVKVNTRCHKIYTALKEVDSLAHITREKPDNREQLYRELVLLWDSDVRTWITEDKYEEFKLNAGRTFHLAAGSKQALLGKIPVKSDFTLVNPHPVRWNNAPCMFRCHFAPGRFHNGVAVEINGKMVESQVEEASYYRDGSIRTADMVLLPQLSGHGIADGKFVEDSTSPPPVFKRASGQIRIKTETTSVELMNGFGNGLMFEGGSDIAPTGCTLLEVLFPKIWPEPLLRNFSRKLHKYYIADFEVKDHLHGGAYAADWGTAEVDLPQNSDAFPVRVPVRCRIKTGLFLLEKTFYVHCTMPRVDIKYHFTAFDLMPDFARLNTMTLNPTEFNREQLKYSLVNGSDFVEQYSLEGCCIRQDEYIYPTSSTHHCMGDTEGWIDISDDEKGIAMLSQKSSLYSVPLLHYEEDGDNFILHVKASIGENDDTGRLYYRGYNTAHFSFVAHRNNIDGVRKAANFFNHPLIVKFS